MLARPALLPLAARLGPMRWLAPLSVQSALVGDHLSKFALLDGLMAYSLVPPVVVH